MPYQVTIKYATRILSFLARNKEAASSNEIFEHAKVPAQYQDRLLLSLCKAGLISCQSGCNGGYSLARGVRDISMWDIMKAAEPDVYKENLFVQGHEDCSADDDVRGLPMFNLLYERQKEYYKATNLSDLMIMNNCQNSGNDD